MIAFLGKSKEKNEELLELMERLAFPCKLVDFLDTDTEGAYTPDNYYLYGGPLPGRPLFWLDFETPPYWSFKSANVREGNIFDGGDRIAHVIFREPYENQCISRIEWMVNGEVYLREFYNAAGIKYADAVVEDGDDKISAWYDREGNTVIRYWPEPDVYSVRRKGRECMYGSREAYFKAFAEDLMAEQGEETVCFYEPELVQYIPEGKKAVLIQFDRADDKLADGAFRSRLNLIAAAQPGLADQIRAKAGGGAVPQIFEIGCIIRKPDVRHVHDAVIVTRSQNIERLKELVEGLPELHFHIAAGTMMAPGLMDFGKYDNVTVYPNSPRTRLLEIMEGCGIYLDINHYLEYDGIVYAARKMDLIVLAFDNTAHQRETMPGRHVYEASDADGMIRDLERLMSEPEYLEERLEDQRSMIEINEDQAGAFRKALGD